MNVGIRVRGVITVLCSVHMSMIFVLVINFKMSTIVGILKYMTKTNTIQIINSIFSEKKSFNTFSISSFTNWKVFKIRVPFLQQAIVN